MYAVLFTIFILLDIWSVYYYPFNYNTIFHSISVVSGFLALILDRYFYKIYFAINFISDFITVVGYFIHVRNPDITATIIFHIFMVPIILLFLSIRFYITYKLL